MIVEKRDKTGRNKVGISLDPTTLYKAVASELFNYRTPDDIYKKLYKKTKSLS